MPTRNLGRLEREVMNLLWRERAWRNVRSVQSLIGSGLAYTTVMTTLDRLYRKGLLERRLEGRAYLYRPVETVEQFDRGLAHELLQHLLGRYAGKPEPVLSCIVDAVSDRDRELLASLDKLVRARLKRERGERR